MTRGYLNIAGRTVVGVQASQALFERVLSTARHAQTTRSVESHGLSVSARSGKGAGRAPAPRQNPCSSLPCPHSAPANQGDCGVEIRIIAGFGRCP